MPVRGTSRFHIQGLRADADAGSVELRYRFDTGPEFRETIQLSDARDVHRNDDGFLAAAHLLLLIAGVSYYKSQAPSTVVVHVPTTSRQRRLVEAVFDHGLREFAYANDLPIPLVNEFVWQSEPVGGAPPATSDPGSIGRPLVPFGAGKDSTIVLDVLPEATPVTVNPTSTHDSVAASLGHELLHVRREVDQLGELTRPDRFNGHVPITAIVSAIAVMVAARDGYDAVVMANEAAASEPTLWIETGGRPATTALAVNHQWSKGAEFETLYAAAVAETVAGVRYFSLLRAVAETDIIRLLSRRTDVLPRLISCNRAFVGRTAGGESEAPQRWCGSCPKCLFTFLLLATELEPSALSEIFGHDLLDDVDRIAGFAELWATEKPFECVGERADAAGALIRLAADPRWHDHRVVRSLRDSAAAALHDASSAGSSAPASVPPLPEAYRRRILDALAMV